MADSKLMGFTFPEFAHLTEADIEGIFGTPEEQRERMRRFRQDIALLHTPEMEARYPGEWVAVHDCHVLGHARTMDELREQLIERGTYRGNKATRKMPGS